MTPLGIKKPIKAALARVAACLVGGVRGNNSCRPLNFASPKSSTNALLSSSPAEQVPKIRIAIQIDTEFFIFKLELIRKYER